MKKIIVKTKKFEGEHLAVYIDGEKYTLSVDRLDIGGKWTYRKLLSDSTRYSGYDCYKFLNDFVNKNMDKFAKEEFAFDDSIKYGVISNGYAIIIGRVFNEIMDEAGYNPLEFLKWARAYDLIKTDKYDNPKNVKNINGKAVRCVFLKIKKE